MSDSIEILEATLAGSEKAVRDRDQEIELLRSRLIIALQAICDSEKIVKDRDSEIAELRSQIEQLKSSMPDPFESQGLLIDNKELGSQLEDRDRKIQTLEDNLDRARSEHLEQLRAIVQMLQPLIGRPYNSTENKDGKVYVHVNHTNEFTHAEKNHAIKLIQKVVCANIKRLDPCVKTISYDDDF